MFKVGDRVVTNPIPTPTHARDVKAIDGDWVVTQEWIRAKLQDAQACRLYSDCVQVDLAADTSDGIVIGKHVSPGNNIFTLHCADPPTPVATEQPC